MLHANRGGGCCLQRVPPLDTCFVCLVCVVITHQGFNKVIEMQRMIDGCDSGLRSLVASIRSTEDLVKMTAKVRL